MGTRHRQRFTRETIEQFVQEVLQKDQPETIDDLVTSLQRQFEVPKSQSIEVIQAMLEEEKFAIRKPEYPAPRTLQAYVKHPYYRWDALLALGPTLAIIPIVALAEEFPEITILALIRAIFGLVFLLFVTGFSLTGLLFPYAEDLDEIERVALSVGLSLVIAILVGLVLNYTWEISLFPILISLVVLTLTIYSSAVFVRIQGLETLKTFLQKAAE
ncbi:MAG: DUF1616 domain-containing protein [Candidatus Heimdallarchaeota archaeon]